MISISLAVVYGYNLLGQILITVVGYTAGDGTCAFPRKKITAAYNLTDNWRKIPNDEMPSQSQSRWIPSLASAILVLLVMVIANVSIPLINWCRR